MMAISTGLILQDSTWQAVKNPKIGKLAIWIPMISCSIRKKREFRQFHISNVENCMINKAPGRRAIIRYPSSGAYSNALLYVIGDGEVTLYVGESLDPLQRLEEHEGLSPHVCQSSGQTYP